MALVASQALTNATFEPLKFLHYDYVPGNTFVRNTGHGVEVNQACGVSIRREPHRELHVRGVSHPLGRE